MNRRTPVTVRIGDEDFQAGLLTCGLSWKLASEIKVVQAVMMKAVNGEALSPEDEATYYPSAVKIASAVLSARHPGCSEEWVQENVLDHELGTLLAKVWAASIPPAKGGGGGPEAKSP